MKIIPVLLCFWFSNAIGQVNNPPPQTPQPPIFNPGDERIPGPDEWIDLKKEPYPINMNQFREAIGYPEMAKQAEIQGKVTFRILVNEEGDIVNQILLKSAHPILTNAVEQNLPILKFSPGIQNGKPVKCWVTLPIDFILTGSKKHELINLDDFVQSIPFPKGFEGDIFTGEINIGVRSDGKGNYHSHKIIYSSDERLTKVVESKIRNLKFTHEDKGGKPDSDYINIPLKIQLKRIK